MKKKLFIAALICISFSINMCNTEINFVLSINGVVLQIFTSGLLSLVLYQYISQYRKTSYYSIGIYAFIVINFISFLYCLLNKTAL